MTLWQLSVKATLCQYWRLEIHTLSSGTSPVGAPQGKQVRLDPYFEDFFLLSNNVLSDPAELNIKNTHTIPNSRQGNYNNNAALFITLEPRISLFPPNREHFFFSLSRSPSAPVVWYAVCRNSYANDCVLPERSRVRKWETVIAIVTVHLIRPTQRCIDVVLYYLYWIPVFSQTIPITIVSSGVIDSPNLSGSDIAQQKLTHIFTPTPSLSFRDKNSLEVYQFSNIHHNIFSELFIGVWIL